MKQQILIYSATRGTVDGTNYSSVWAESQDVLSAPDTIGKPPMKINCDSKLIDDLRGKLPAVVEADMRMISASGSRGGLYISSVNLANIQIPAATK
jgi:hypothetical protein